jgi:hypothetical protein
LSQRGFDGILLPRVSLQANLHVQEGFPVAEVATRVIRFIQVLAFAALAAGALASSRPAATRPGDSQRILFVGNSLTYVGNLPAVVEAIGASNGKKIFTEMLVAGGATLTDRLNDGSVEKLLRETPYDYVVLQERGGDLACSADVASSCDSVVTSSDSARAHLALGKSIRTHHAKAILLGTYQTVPAFSKGTELSERLLARKIDAIYIPVSERLRLAAEKAPDMNWFYPDDMHPGHDLALMEAIGVYEAIFNSVPSSGELRIDRTMFGPSAHLNGSIPASRQQSALPAEPYIYDQQRVEKVIAIGRSYL